MEVVQTALPGVLILIPRLLADDRGYFFETFNAKKFCELVAPVVFCQDNESLSQKNVIRGLHYQIGESAQSKLVSVVRGAIWDVAVDLRSSSPTFKQSFGIELTSACRKQLFIPKGFAHGFLSLEDDTIVQYKVDGYYSAQDERGIAFDDGVLDIKWPMSGAPKLSPKDQNHPKFTNADVFA
ncbi:MAG: dTDP-4-dehydrorhamnose 3,5-epimerase [Hymenobacter sp.]|nr:MAG: dTDP-4-dehydrorhamnose 3,5-epimerase [Hymenobacter sp.]